MVLLKYASGASEDSSPKTECICENSCGAIKIFKII